MDVSKLSLHSVPSSQINSSSRNSFSFEVSDDLDLKYNSLSSVFRQLGSVKKMNLMELLRKKCSLKNSLIREFLAEILCTFLQISFGCGAVAQFVLGPKNNFNSFLSVNFAWGIAVTICILVGGKISGCHMNPAVSLSMLIMGKMSIAKFFIYIIGQCIGALLGSVMVYIVYLDALNNFDGGIRSVDGVNATAGIWATYPASYVSTWGAFLDQFFGTTLLITCILAIGDPKNHEISNGTRAIVIGNVVFMIGLSYGSNCGYAINPVRDFIPRLFTSFSGWGLDVFKVGNYYFWIPIFAPLTASVFATFFYAFMIGNHWPDENSGLKTNNL